MLLVLIKTTVLLLVWLICTRSGPDTTCWWLFLSKTMATATGMVNTVCTRSGPNATCRRHGSFQNLDLDRHSPFLHAEIPKTKLNCGRQWGNLRQKLKVPPQASHQQSDHINYFFFFKCLTFYVLYFASYVKAHGSVSICYKNKNAKLLNML